MRADPAAPLGYVEVSDRDSGIVSVTRNGQRLNTRTPLRLQPGDVVQTSANAGAVIRLAGGGEAVLAPNTRVRMGSLEVFFGRVLADLRGLFEIEDQTLVAAVEGTRFLFESRDGRRTRVAVLEGRVRCVSKTGSWQPVRLGPRQAMRSRSPEDRKPRIERLSRAEIQDIERWSGGIREAARPGFCCYRGKVFDSLSNNCRGHFETSEKRARDYCRSGWCCRKGKVYSSISGECRGSFHTRQSLAEKACTPQPPPPVQGWCCISGKLSSSERNACYKRQGQFYTSSKEAKKRCLPIIK